MKFQNEKTPFQAIKTRSLKSRKVDIFPKAHGFGPIIAIFQTFSFLSIQARKMSFMIVQKKNQPFQGIKRRRSKRRKIDIFQNVCNSWLWSKNARFSNFFVQAIQARKMSFMICLNEKTPLQAGKTESSNSRKIDIIPKGLAHGFVPKMAIFPTFFFQAIYAKKMSFMIFQNGKTPFQAIKTRSSNSQKLTFFQRV